MNEYFLIGIKTILFLIIILILIRIMGKRELGELNVFDIIISFMISEIFSNAISDPYSDVFLAIFPIFLIFIIQILISYIVLKSKKLRSIIEDKPAVIINNGILEYEIMKKLRYNINDLLQQVREKGIDDINKISFAILESNGELTIIRKEEKTLLSPFPLISDGELMSETLKSINIDEAFLKKQLEKLNIFDYKEIFIAFIDTNYNLIIFSEKFNNIKYH